MSKPFEPALCTVGVFGVICRLNDQGGQIEILVNVRTDQETQREKANLPKGWSGVIVDLPGGTLQVGDLGLETCLEREVNEETDGCGCRLIGGIIGPFPLIRPDTGRAEKPHDLAFVFPVELLGEPSPSPEASEHRWVTLQQLETQDEIRLPGKLGKSGRMANMIRAAISSFCTIKNIPRRT